ncbi:MAG: DUF1015 domain-containing protein [Acidobacteriota bacterium]
MPALLPFRAWRYATDVVGALADVATPPYDVISPERRRQLAARSPHNLVHLTLPLSEGSRNPYEAAAHRFAGWRRSGALRQDSVPTLTIHRQTYTIPDSSETRTRVGVLGLLSLEAIPAGAVRPHERTLDAPREDRQRLIQTVGAQLSPIFMLAADPEGSLSTLLAGALPRASAEEYVDDDGVRHVVEIVDDPDTLRAIDALLTPRPLVIADGHHRFESARACHRALSAATGVSETARRACGRVLVEVVSAASPGLVILPTHRTLSQVDGFDPAVLVARLAGDAQVTPMPLQPGRSAATIEKQLVAAGPGTLGMVAGSPQRAWLIEWRDRGGNEPADPLDRLDVVFLHRHVLDECLGIDDEAIADGRHIGFIKSIPEAIEQLDSGAVQAVFLLNSTPLADLEKVTEAGQRMPQKSTYFYPKVPAGLVVHAFE